MHTKTTVILLSSALAVSTGLWGWQLLSTHQLQQELRELQQQVAQLRSAGFLALNPPLNAPGKSLPTPAPGTGLLNPQALGQPLPVNPPASSLGQPPATSVLPGSAPDPFDNFFSGSADVFGEFEQMQQQMLERMDQLMGTALPGTGLGGGAGTVTDPFATPGFGGSPATVPDISFQEHSDAYVLTISVPEGSDIELSTQVDGDQLNIEGKLTIKEQNQPGARSFSSVQTQQFARRMPLPHNVDPLGITNETHANEVIITLPKVG